MNPSVESPSTERPTVELTDPVVVGQVNGLFGTRGWVKVFSHTRPRDNLLHYDPWYLRGPTGWQRFAVREGRSQRGGLVARLDGIDDRDQAAALLKRDIGVPRSQLAPLPARQYYWADLVGLAVVNREGQALGRVRALFDTGAHDVLEVSGERTRLIPCVMDVYVLEVDLAAGRMLVDWHVDD